MTTPSIRPAAGSRAVERRLLDDLEELLDGARNGDLRLDRPIRVVVPSSSLRQHVAAAVVRRRREGVLGVQVQSLTGVALEVLERAGESPSSAAALFPLFVRRETEREDGLRGDLGELRDGYAAIAATVHDLLNAGMIPANLDELEASLGSAAGDPLRLRRAREVLRVAARTYESMERRGLARPSSLFAAAAALLEDDPGLLPARRVLIHGFAEATGLAVRLIRRLVCQGASVYLDVPPDPASPARRDPGAGFVDRLRRRVLDAGSRQTDAIDEEPIEARLPQEHTSPPPEIRAFRAPGTAAEVREVAARIRSLLDDGAPVERIGVIARSLTPYQTEVRTRFRRLGIPFSGVSDGPMGAAGRRLQALAELLRRRERLPCDRWLDAWGDGVGASGPAPGARGFDLRLALRSLGVARLGGVARLEFEPYLDDRGRYGLPARRGLLRTDSGVADVDTDEEVDADEEAQRGGGHTVAARRTVDGAELERLRERAARLTRRLRQWPDEAPLSEHVAALRSLAREELGWERDDPSSETAEEVLGGLEGGTVGEVVMGPDEFLDLARRALRRAGRVPLGGRGGGVQVLPLMKARGRTYEHLFVMGMNRGLFPRPVREDPVLPDSIRERLLEALPDLPIKRRGFDEERYLFAQVMSASPRVTLSWQFVGDDGKVRPASPLVDRLLLGEGGTEVETVPDVHGIEGEPDSVAAETDDRPPETGPRGTGADRRAVPGDPVRTPREHAVRAGLHGDRRRFGEALPVAEDEARRRAERTGGARGRSGDDLARARLAVVEELDPDLSRPEGRRRGRRLGPYFGFIGPVREEADPRRRDLHVTTVERLSRCGWQVMLQKLLGLEPPPDPLQQLPAAEPHLVGQTVHDALERLVEGTGAEPRNGGRRFQIPSLEEVIRRQPTTPRAPDSDELDRLLDEVASRVLREAGIRAPGLGRVLALRARPFVEVASRLDGWQEGTLRVLAAEVAGSLRVEDGSGGRRDLRFRADRVDGSRERLRLTDYKTGKPLSEGVKSSTRRRHFVNEVLRGRRLQAVAYLEGARAVVDPTDPPDEGAAEGRFLFLGEEIDDEARSYAVRPEDRDLVEAFRDSVGRLLAAWDAGVFFPRMVDPAGEQEPVHCSWCEVAEACLRGDSGARRRLVRWAERHAGSDEAETGETRQRSPGADALAAVWGLPERTSGDRGSG